MRAELINQISDMAKANGWKASQIDALIDEVVGTGGTGVVELEDEDEETDEDDAEDVDTGGAGAEESIPVAINNLTEAHARSFEETQSLLSSALHARLPNHYCYPVAVHDSYLIYSCRPKTDDYSSKSKLFSLSYSIDDNDAVTFGDDQTEVIQRISYDPITTESSPTPTVINLIETASLPAVAEPGFSSILLKVIQPGFGSSGYYPQSTLERDGPTAFPAGTHMYCDHPTASESQERPERSIRDLVAVTTTPATFNEKGPSGPGLYAQAKVHEQWRPFVADCYEHIGASIRATGRGKDGVVEGKRTKIIEGLDKGISIDFVTKPGAGGKVVALMESAYNHAREFSPTSQHSGANDMTEPTTTTPTTPTAPAVSSPTAPAVTVEQYNRLRAKLTASEAEKFIRANVTSLPAAAQGRVVNTLLTSLPLRESDGELDVDKLKTLTEAAVATELEYIKSVAPARASLSAEQLAGQLDAREAGQSDEEKDKMTKSMVSAFKSLGLTEAQAVVAARGR